MRKIQLSIPEPCHEDWDNLSISRQGKYCQLCRKEVIDFTGMSDRQVLKIIGSSENVCGRVVEDQLGRDLLYPKKNNFIFKHAWKLLVPTFLLSKGAIAQGGITKIEPTRFSITPRTTTTPSCTIRMGGVASGIGIEKNFTFSGILTDSTTGDPIKNASIIIQSKGVRADNEGRFRIRGKTINSSVMVELSAVGYEKRFIPVIVPISGFELEIFVKLTPYFQALKPVVINAQEISRSLMGLMGGISYTKPKNSFIKKIKDSLVANRLNVYPNPVQSGGTFNLETNISKPGNYSFRVTDINGRVVITRAFNLAVQKLSTSVRCDERLFPGSYIITILDSNGKIVQTAKLVVL